MPETSWPHVPCHKRGECGTYMVTAGTYGKMHHFAGQQRGEVPHRGLLAVAAEFDWRLEAWAVFSHHYHFIGHSLPTPATLSPMPAKLHQRTAKWVNRLDGVMGRKVWHNVWETRLTREKSYPARLHCVHRNAVRLAAFKLRARYRDLLPESIRRTVTTPEEAEEEPAHLRRLFCD